MRWALLLSLLMHCLLLALPSLRPTRWEAPETKATTKLLKIRLVRRERVAKVDSLPGQADEPALKPVQVRRPHPRPSPTQSSGAGRNTERPASPGTQSPVVATPTSIAPSGESQTAVPKVEASESFPRTDSQSAQGAPTAPPRQIKVASSGSSRPSPGSTSGPLAEPLGSLPDSPEGDLTPPELLKGPDKIPLPQVLQQRAGHCVVGLRCQVGINGRAQVSVMDSTGMIALDDCFVEAFSGLHWWPAEQQGKLVPSTVRLTIEATWSLGSQNIDWKARRPKYN